MGRWGDTMSRGRSAAVWAIAPLAIAPLAIGGMAAYTSAHGQPGAQRAETHSAAAVPPALVPQPTASTGETAQTTDEAPHPTPAGLYSTAAGEAFILEHTAMEARISGSLARVEVTQRFQNPFEQPLEAIYVFPLPDEAAVDAMDIRIGDRLIQGTIARREEAEALYEQAREQGRTAGLLEQERANVFTQSLANIQPGETVEVTLRYTDALAFEADSYEFVFPTVVGPRYIPGRPLADAPQATSVATDQVPDADRITPPVLPPEVRSGHELSVTVRLDGEMPIQQVRSPSHDIVVSDGAVSQGGPVVQLVPGDTLSNKDLILRYRVSGETTRATLLTHGDERGDHFALYLLPALTYRPEEILPKDVVFLIDTSGSQQGEPLAQSKRLMTQMLAGLNREDTFTVIDFANATTRLSPSPLANTATNRRRALDYVDGLTASGGTELLNGIDAVLNFPPAEAGRLRSIVLLTDGYIGNEAEVIARVQQGLQAGNRLYSFGVGSSVNRFLLDRLAEVGRGLSWVVRQDEPVEEAIAGFLARVSNPVLTDLAVTWEGTGDAPLIYPQRLPDLFDQQPLVLFGRAEPGQAGQLRLTGTRSNGEPYETVLPLRADETGNPAIAQLWGRARIKALMLAMGDGETVAGVEAVTRTALDYRLLSAYTAFVAVSQEVRVDPDGVRRRVEVPVALPEGVSYEGIFGPAALPSSALGLQRGATQMTNRGAGLSSPAGGITDAEATRPAGDGETVNIDIEGLDAPLEAALQQRLVQSLQPLLRGAAPPTDGITVWQVRLRRGQVVQVLLDEQRSTLSDRSVLAELRRRLQVWQPAGEVEGTLRMKIELRYR